MLAVTQMSADDHVSVFCAPVDGFHPLLRLELVVRQRRPALCAGWERQSVFFACMVSEPVNQCFRG